MPLRVCGASCASAPTRSMCSRRRPVAWSLSGRRSRTSACRQSPCDEARALRNGGEQATTHEGWFRRRWVFASHETQMKDHQSASRPSLGRRREKHRGNRAVRSKTQRVRSWPLSSAFSLQKNPRPARLTHPSSNADRETATFPSYVLLPSMACVLRQHELVTDV
jgi:hypothetical protein